MLDKFMHRYGNAYALVSYHRRQHQRMLHRTFFSYGMSLGLVLMMMFLAGNKYPIPIFIPLLQGGLFIYGSVILGLGFRLLAGPIASAETEKFMAWAALCELQTIPFKYNQND